MQILWWLHFNVCYHCRQSHWWEKSWRRLHSHLQRLTLLQEISGNASCYAAIMIIIMGILLFYSQVVLQNVDKAQLKLKTRKDNVAGMYTAFWALDVNCKLLAQRKSSPFTQIVYLLNPYCRTTHQYNYCSLTGIKPHKSVSSLLEQAIYNQYNHKSWFSVLIWLIWINDIHVHDMAISCTCTIFIRQN